MMSVWSKLPLLSLGIPRVSAPAKVASLRSQEPVRPSFIYAFLNVAFLLAPAFTKSFL